jgi:hypothetical protein
VTQDINQAEYKGWARGEVRGHQSHIGIGSLSGKSNRFRVVSIRRVPDPAAASIDYDYPGSVAHAIARVEERWRSGQYRMCWAERRRVTKGRLASSRRYLKASGPFAERS